MNATYLCHYGVLGMKWGHRKSKTKKNKKVKKRSADAEKVREIKTKSLDEMTNDELKTVTERMRLVNDFQAQARQTWRNGRHWANATLDKTVNVYVSTITAPNKVIGAAKTIATGTIDGIKHNQQMKALQMP